MPEQPASIGENRLREVRKQVTFWIRRSSSERRGDFNPPDSCAAQRTLWARPSVC
jgi:hypothetical protein